QFVPTLDGKQLITVEDLAGPDGTLHPAQHAMVDTNGSQCGFCTPGFVMSLFALLHESSRPSVDEINDALAGNLCRCTGYGPICAAAQRMYGLAAADRFDEARARTATALRRLQGSEAIDLPTEAGRYFAPSSIAELAALLQQHPDANLLAGGTDVGLWVT